MVLSSLLPKVNKVSFFTTLHDVRIKNLHLQLSLFDEVILLCRQLDLSLLSWFVVVMAL